MADGTSEDPTVFVIGRELNEVHLLLDNLAANPATNLSAVTAQTRPDGLASDWIDQVCRINWPPDKSEADRARQAALLIRAKDYLNSLTYPASGASIAFTLLVTQGAKAKRRWRWWWQKKQIVTANDATATAQGKTSPVERIDDAPSRRSMAADAYPDLVAKAQSFRRGMTAIRACMVGLLAATCALSWYVAFGNSQLATYAAADQDVEAARKQVAGLELRGETEPSAQTDSTGGAPVDPVTAAPTTVQSVFAPLCGTPASDTPTGTAAPRTYRTAGDYLACRDRDIAEDRKDRAEDALGRWLAPLRWICRGGCTPSPRFKGDNQHIQSDAKAMADILGGAVLPFLYGVLGAAAAVVRALSRKVKYSLLTPRDLVLSWQQLALGAVIGACIGLFFAPTGDGESGLLGPAPLSGSALSFLAGFGVESVFQTLEALILRIFNVPEPARPADMTPPQTPPVNAAPTPSPAPAPTPTPTPTPAPAPTPTPAPVGT